MLKKNIHDVINSQINAELWSAYLYLSMSMDAQDKGCKGVAHWFRKQYEEERTHAFKFMDYLTLQMAKVELKPINEVSYTWDSPRCMFEQALVHERAVTLRINNLYALAESERDYATASLLQWFVSEQLEEEASMQDMLNMLDFIGDDRAALVMFDNSLLERD